MNFFLSDNVKFIAMTAQTNHSVEIYNHMFSMKYKDNSLPKPLRKSILDLNKIQVEIMMT